MEASSSPLLDDTIKRVVAVWAQRLGVPASALLSNEKSVASKNDSRGITALELRQSVVVVCPPALASVLSPLSGDDLLNMALLLELLKDFEPNPIGVATISYADVATLSKASGSNPARFEHTQDVDTFLSSCTPSEQEESGLANMPFLFAAQSEDGKTGAMAGYEIWNSNIAQMGILTTPSQRRKNLAFTAARAGAYAALEAGLIPQWRCRIENESSYRLGQRLGFHDLGRQLAIDLTL